MNSSKRFRNNITIIFSTLVIIASGCMKQTNSILEVTSDNFEEVIQNEFAVIVFIPQDCMDCKNVIGSLQAIKQQMSDVVIGQMDVQKNQEFIKQIRLQIEDGKPTIVLFSKGDYQDGLIGLQSTEELTELVQDMKDRLQLWHDIETGKVSFIEAYDFTLEDLDGNEVTLSEIDNLVILDFWATWCPPCKAEIPYLVEFYNNYKNRGLTVIGVSAEDTETLLNFKKELAATGTDINYILLKDSGREVSTMFGIKSIPTTFFISPSGKLLKKEVGFTEEFVPEFQKLIEENLPK